MCHLPDNTTGQKYDLIRAIPDGALGLFTDDPERPNRQLAEWPLQRFCMAFEVLFSPS